MENASKALLMAAEVLIGILILTLAIYLINVFGDSAKQQEDAIYAKNLTEFNARFLKFETPKVTTMKNLIKNEENETTPIQDDYITGADVVTLINLVQQSNVTYASKAYGSIDEQSQYFISIYVDYWHNRNGKSEQQIEEKIKEILEDSTTKVNGEEIYQRYFCQVSLSENTGRVNKIIIKGLSEI